MCHSAARGDFVPDQSHPTMSLQTDRAFFDAIKADAAIMRTIGSRLYSTAIPLPDEDLLNAPLPYAIVSFDGMTNIGQTKDDPYDGDTDSVTVSIELAASTRPELARLADATRRAVAAYFRAHAGAEFVPSGCDLSASAVAYDAAKPCYWQTLTYRCESSAET